MSLELTDLERLSRASRSLRNYTRDKKELNRLLQGRYESNDEELKQCIIQALIDWNMTPPPIGIVTIATHPNKMLLLECAAIEHLKAAMQWHMREHMPSQDGGTSADDHAKAGEYSGLIQILSTDYERKKIDLKTSINIMMAISGGGLPSEYGMAFSYGGETW